MKANCNTFSLRSGRYLTPNNSQLNPLLSIINTPFTSLETLHFLVFFTFFSFLLFQNQLDLVPTLLIFLWAVVGIRFVKLFIDHDFGHHHANDMTNLSFFCTILLSHSVSIVLLYWFYVFLDSCLILKKSQSSLIIDSNPKI